MKPVPIIFQGNIKKMTAVGKRVAVSIKYAVIKDGGHSFKM